jgi:hypothetical protein
VSLMLATSRGCTKYRVSDPVAFPATNTLSR